MDSPTRSSDEQHFRTLFQNMGQGYLLLEMIRDAEGRVVDRRLIEANPAFERLTGIKVSEGMGRTTRDFVATPEPELDELYDRVAKGGAPEHFEREVASLGRWYEVWAHCAGNDRVSTLYEDITERKRTQAAMRAMQQRQAYLLKLGDTLRPIGDAASAKAEAMRVLTEHLGVDRAQYFEVDASGRFVDVRGAYAKDTAPLKGRFRLDDFGRYPRQWYEAGRTYVVSNTAELPITLDERNNYESAGIRATVGAPITKDGRLVALLGVSHLAPREWSADDVAIIEDTAERIWAAAERAAVEQALRESEERHAFLLELSDLLSSTTVVAACTQNAARMLGEHLHADLTAYADIQGVMGSRTAVIRAQHVRRGLPLPDQIVYDAADRRWLSEHLRLGTPVVITNMEEDGRLDELARRAMRGHGCCALIAVSLLREGREVMNFAVQHSGPRDWTASDVRLVEEVAERAWAAAERVRAEIALRDSEARLAATFKALPIATALLDSQGRVTMSNKEMRRFLPNAKMPSQDPARRWRWRAWNPTGALLDIQDYPGSRALRGETVLPGQEMLYTQDDGREVWTCVTSVPVKDERGDITGHISVINDIDALKRSAEALRESQERFRQFAAASSVGFWVRDAKTLSMEYVSPAIPRIYGVDALGLLGDISRWSSLIVPEYRQGALDQIELARSGESVVHEFCIHRRSDGASRWIRNTDFPLLDGNGHVQRVGGIAEDITQARSVSQHQAE